MSVWIRKGSGFVMSVADSDDEFYASDADWEKKGEQKSSDSVRPSSGIDDDLSAMKVHDLRAMLIARGVSEAEAKGMTKSEIIEHLQSDEAKHESK